MDFKTLKLKDAAVERAPDGSLVRVLPDGERGGLGHFTLPAGTVSRAVAHRRVEELWFFLAGEGEFWRRSTTAEAIVPITPGTALTIPPGCAFQFRAGTGQDLVAVAATLPPWPGPEEAELVEGIWPATAAPALD